MKKLVSLLMVLTMVLSMVPTAWAEGTEPVLEGITSSDNTYTIGEGSGSIKGGTFADGTMTVNGNGSVVIDGVTFSNANLVVNSSGDVTITNCIFAPTQKYTKTTSYRTAVNVTASAKIIFRDNTFNGAANGYYNALELPIKENTAVQSAEISGNSFSASIENNYFSAYRFADNAVIDIKNNSITLANKGSNAIRLSNATSTNATFNLSNNSYGYGSGGASVYEGYILLQDYSKDSGKQDFSKFTINIDHLKAPADAETLLYVYDDQDGIITTNQPKVTCSDGSIDRLCIAKAGNTYYATLAGAVAAGGNVTLLKDVTLTETCTVDKTTTLNLNGKTITGNNVRVFNVKGGTLTLDGTGTITTTAGGETPIVSTSSVIRVGADDTAASTAGLVIGEKVTINAPATYGVSVFGETTAETVTVRGTINVTGGQSCIAGNGTAKYAGTTIIIEPTAKLTAKEYTIYHPQAGTLTINGGTFQGGIEAKAGTIAVSGNPVIRANGPVNHAENGNGASTTGYAIVLVENKSYVGGAKATIQSGTFVGPVAVVKDNDVENGKNATIAISGGKFSVKPDSGYIASTATGKTFLLENGYYVLGTALSETPAETVSGEATVEKDTNANVNNTTVEAVGKNVEAEGLNNSTQVTDMVNKNTVTGNSTGEVINGNKETEKTVVEVLNSTIGSNSNIDAKDVIIVVQTYPKVTVKAEDLADENINKSITLDIKGMAQKAATTEENKGKLVFNGTAGGETVNAVKIGNEVQTTINGPVVLTVGIPKALYDAAQGNNNTLYVLHTKDNGKQYNYTATVSGNEQSGYTATFTSENGFSTFKLSAQEIIAVNKPSRPSGGSKDVESAETFDAGVALYGAMALSSALGAAYVSRKKHR